MRIILTVFILCVVLSNLSLFAQSNAKSEIEERIQKSEFPHDAAKLINSQLSDAKKVKYFLEVDGSDTSYEIKFIKNKHFYSVEFDNNGAFEDVEMKVDIKELPNKVVDNIRRYLTENFRKHKIRKIQVQYKNKKATSIDLEKLFEGKSDLFDISYEIECAVKDADGKPLMYEFHFDNEGKYLDKRIFKQQSDDNILY
jgi:hypothetical protein